MRRFLPLLLVVLALVELSVTAWVARAIGLGATILVLLVAFLLGLWVVKLAGLGVFRRFMATSVQGQVPHREIVDGFILLIAGALLLIPGLVTSALGLLLLAPPTRALVRARLGDRVTGGSFVGSTVAARFGRSEVFEVDSVEVPADRSESPGDPSGPPGLSP